MGTTTVFSLKINQTFANSIVKPVLDIHCLSRNFSGLNNMEHVKSIFNINQKIK